VILTHPAILTHSANPPDRKQHDFVEYSVAGGSTSAAMVIAFCSYLEHGIACSGMDDCGCFVNALLVRRLDKVKRVVVGGQKLQLLRGYPCFSLNSGVSFLPVESIVKKAHMISVFSAELPLPQTPSKYYYHMQRHFMLP
jgi:hypothetical protein